MLQADVGMISTYNPLLVVLSIVIAVFASYTALDLTSRVTVSQGWTRRAWLIGGAIVMGIGIWSMHFVAMLAFRLPIPMGYDVLTVILSVLPAIVASGGALFLTSRPILNVQQLLIGGVLMGIGVASMHYIGMAAMQMEAATHYDPALFVVSVAIAIVASVVALSIAFQLRLQMGRTGRRRRKLSSAFIMAIAISGMHYTGMAAASFTPTRVAGAAMTKTMQGSLSALALGIGVATLIILGFTLLTSFVDRRMVTQAVLLKQQEAEAIEQANLLYELQQAQEVLRLRDRAVAAASNGIVISDPRQPDDPIVFCNPAFEKMTGYSQKEVLGRNCRFLQGPDTDPATIEQIRSALRQEQECHVVIKNYRKDGTPFWCELSISPVMSLTGQVINFVGIQSDITLRRQVEEELRRSKEVLQRQLVELIGDIEEVAIGDLTARANVTTGQIGIVADFFNTIIESLRQIVIQVKQGAQQVNVSVGENSDAIRQLADEALQQAEEITCTLDSVNRMNISIQEVANSAHQAAEVARMSANTALDAGEAMERTVASIFMLRETITETAKKIKRFGESSQEISKVVILINEIALQTNLLSINASLEASRVGEESQGFMIVAQEVGRLAAQSAQATQEIEHIAKNIQSETDAVIQAIEQGTTQVVEGAHLVKDVKQSMEKIVEVSRQIDELVQSISQTTVSQAQTSQAVALFMQEVAKTSERTADSSRVVSTSLQQTMEVTQQLQASVSVFKTGE